jgi:3'(2'), 5'-bisphosphate nucleotidase
MRLLASSITSANRAGEIIRDVMSKGELGIIDKGKNDPQTEADRSAQRMIIASLNELYPNVKVIGEEGATDLSLPVPKEWIVTELDSEMLSETCPEPLKHIVEDDLVVWVDPLDGTSEYTHGFLEHVTVLIGISVKNEAIGGVIHQPYFNFQSGTPGRTIWGLKGLGTGGFTPAMPPIDKLIITTTRSHSNALVQSALDSLSPDEILRVGGAGYKVLQLLEGKAHAYVFASAGCKKWDTCAPEAVLEAHGGTLTDLLGNHYTYGAEVKFPNKLGVLATAKGVDHAAIINKIPTTVKDAMNQ